MAIEQILAVLIQERDRLEQAIQILQADAPKGEWTFHTPHSTTTGPKKRAARTAEQKKAHFRADASVLGREAWNAEKARRCRNERCCSGCTEKTHHQRRRSQEDGRRPKEALGCDQGSEIAALHVCRNILIQFCCGRRVR
jgi:hypothetical protein